MMTLAQDVGLDELKTACEDHVISSLSVTNACTFLMAVMDIQEKSSGKLISKQINRFVRFKFSRLNSQPLPPKSVVHEVRTNEIDGT